MLILVPRYCWKFFPGVLNLHYISEVKQNYSVLSPLSFICISQPLVEKLDCSRATDERSATCMWIKHSATET
jgi:hypothetical protein